MKKLVMISLLFISFWLIDKYAYADGKWGDAPVPFGQEGLVVTWVGPLPKNARIDYFNKAPDILQEVVQVNGPIIPEKFPQKYTYNVEEVGVFNSSTHWDIESFMRWEKRFNIPMEPRPQALFKNYLGNRQVLFSTLVQHPKVPDPQNWINCSIVLQFGVIIYDNAEETLFMQSFFHSSKDKENFVNFVPAGGIKMSFASKTIWFPLELTEVIGEPNSYVVLDILTTKPLTSRIPKPFMVEKRGKMRHEGKIYHVTRMTGVLAANEKWPDLNLQPDPGRTTKKY